MPLEKNVLPYFQISGDERLTAALQLKSSDQKQERRCRSVSTPRGRDGRIRTAQSRVKEPQPMWVGKVRLPTSAYP